MRYRDNRAVVNQSYIEIVRAKYRYRQAVKCPNYRRVVKSTVALLLNSEVVQQQFDSAGSKTRFLSFECRGGWCGWEATTLPSGFLKQYCALRLSGKIFV